VNLAQINKGYHNRLFHEVKPVNMSPPGQWSSGGREQSPTTLWWVRGWGRPSPPTSRWPMATTTAGTPEEKRRISPRGKKSDGYSGVGHRPVSSAAWGEPLEEEGPLHDHMSTVQTAPDRQQSWDTTMIGVGDVHVSKKTVSTVTRGGRGHLKPLTLLFSFSLKVECFS